MASNRQSQYAQFGTLNPQFTALPRTQFTSQTTEFGTNYIPHRSSRDEGRQGVSIRPGRLPVPLLTERDAHGAILKAFVGTVPQGLLLNWMPILNMLSYRAGLKTYALLTRYFARFELGPDDRNEYIYRSAVLEEAITVPRTLRNLPPQTGITAREVTVRLFTRHSGVNWPKRGEWTPENMQLAEARYRASILAIQVEALNVLLEAIRGSSHPYYGPGPVGEEIEFRDEMHRHLLAASIRRSAFNLDSSRSLILQVINNLGFGSPTDSKEVLIVAGPRYLRILEKMVPYPQAEASMAVSTKNTPGFSKESSREGTVIRMGDVTINVITPERFKREGPDYLEEQVSEVSEVVFVPVVKDPVEIFDANGGIELTTEECFRQLPDEFFTDANRAEFSPKFYAATGIDPGQNFYEYCAENGLDWNTM